MNNLTIIDLDFVSFWACHNKKGQEPKTLDQVYQYIDNLVFDILNTTKADKYICFLSSGQTFRHKEFGQYKANRKPLKMDYLFEAKTYLKTKWKAIKHQELEADDLCLICQKQLESKYNITVCSTDKDILKTRGKRYSPKDRKFSNIDQNQEDYNFWISMVTGDVIDNVKGIPGKGIKAAEQIMVDIKCPPARILKNYIQHFGEYRGIEEFYKNYKMLKILDEYPGVEFTEDMLLNNNNESKKEDSKG